MARSIELFQFITEYYRWCRIYPLQPSQDHFSFNLRNLIYFVCWVQFLLTSILFLLFEANSMFHYGIVFYTLLSLICSMGMYLFPIFQRRNTFQFNKCCEGLIESSKLMSFRSALFRTITNYTIIRFCCRSERYKCIQRNYWENGTIL